MSKNSTDTDSFKVTYKQPETGSKQGLSWLVGNMRFENKLMLMALFFAVIPLIGYAMLSLTNFRQFSIESAERDLEHLAKSLLMLCEAQEALDRIKESGAPNVENVDAISGASPSWRDGNEFQSLRGMLKNIRVAQTGYCYVFDSKGDVIIHPRLENEDYNKLPDYEKQVFHTLRDIAMTAPTGQISTYRYPWPDDKGHIRSKIAKLVYFEPYDWIIGVAAHENEILQPYVSGRNIFIFILTATILLVAVMVVVFSRLIMRPIKHLTKASAQISQGDYSVEVPAVRSKDEIGSLARSFRLMVYEIRHAHNDLLEWSKTLEQKVDKRSKELKKAHERMLMAEKMASLGKLSAMVAHEINNPLSGILSYLKLTDKLLKRDSTDEKNLENIYKYLDISASEVKRVGEIVRNLLMFSKRNFGEFGTDHLNTIIEKSSALIKHSLDVKGMELIIDIDQTGSDLLYCDPSGLQQMLMALMVNAIDAMDKGGKLTIKTNYSQQDEITITVSDTGKGIPDDVLPHIFEPFFSQKESKKSIGMGLSVVYGIVHSHRGTIQVNSKLKEGTTFVITLPREQAPGEEPDKESEESDF